MRLYRVLVTHNVPGSGALLHSLIANDCLISVFLTSQYARVSRLCYLGV
jgi:hypothetical protein